MGKIWHRVEGSQSRWGSTDGVRLWMDGLCSINERVNEAVKEVNGRGRVLF